MFYTSTTDYFYLKLKSSHASYGSNPLLTSKTISYYSPLGLSHVY